jgi:hypothetical protein
MVELDEHPRDVATLVVPGAVGLGVGAFVGLVVVESVAVVGLLAVAGAAAGHAAGIYRLMD